MRGRILPMARALVRRGHETEVLTLSGTPQPPYASSDLDAGVVVTTVGPNIRATGTGRPGIAETHRRWREGTSALTRALSDRDAEVLVLAKPQLQNTRPALSWADKHHRSILVDSDDLESLASRTPFPLSWWASRTEQRALASARTITACSPYLVAYARRSAPSAQVELIPTGLEIPQEITAARLRERFPIPADAPLLLYVGSLSISSGHRVDRLLDAFELLAPTALPTTHLVISGDGLDADHLRTRVLGLSMLAARVHFTGPFTPPQDIAMAREADLLIDPVDASPVSAAKSSSRMMLALATGTSIVAGNIGIRPTLLPRSLHAMHLYDPRSLSDFVSTMRTALQPEQRARFAEDTALERDRWTWDRLGPQFVTAVEHTEKTR